MGVPAGTVAPLGAGVSRASRRATGNRPNDPNAAANSARAVCIAVPERDDRRFAIADRVLRSLREVDRALLDAL